MNISYRGHTFSVGTAGVVIAKRSNLNEMKQQLSITNIVNITGAIVEANEANLLAAIAAMENAFSEGDGDFAMTLPGGATAFQLLSGSCIGGVRIATPVNYPEGKGTEFVNRRSFNIVLEGDVETPGASGYLVSYAETISYTGNGGARVALLEPLNGAPIEQTTHQQTVCRATQSGQAVGFMAHPSVPSPYFDGMLNDKWNVNYSTPKKQGDAYINFPVSWSYQFESATPITVVAPAAY